MYFLQNCDFLVYGIIQLPHKHCVLSSFISTCIGVPIHGGWGVWIPSGICSVTCGGGIRRYERQCNNPPPRNGGLPCRGDDSKYEPCNTECCPGEYTNDAQL